MERPTDKKDIYRLSRGMYIAEAALEYFISLLVTGAFIAKLTADFGFSDSLTAVLISFVALGCSFQLFAVFFFRGGSVKRRVTFLHIVNQLLFMSVYLVPFFNRSRPVKTVLFIVLLMAAYFFLNIVFAPKTNWFMSLVDDHKRGRFTAIKEAVSLVGGFLFNLLMGAIIDHFEAKGEIRTSFIIAAATIFLLTVLHTLTLVLSREKPAPKIPDNVSIVRRFKNVFGDKTIMKVIGISVFWTICTHITTAFFGTYQTKELGFSMKFVAILSVIGAVSRIASSFVLARIADKRSFAYMLKYAYAIATLGFLVATFMVPSNGKLFYTTYACLYAAAMGGINSAEINLIFDYASPENRSDALMVKQAVYGLAGFFATLAVTPLVNYIQANGNQIFGINVYAQQVLSAISVVLGILVIVYLQKVVLKIEPHREND